MKKIILSCIVAVLMISSIVLITSARNEDNYQYVIQFEETQKAYPVMDSLDDIIGLKSYYSAGNMIFKVIGNDDITQLSIIYSSTGFYITNFSLSANYPTYTFDLSNVEYDDIGFARIDGTIYLVTITNGVPTIYDNYDMISDGFTDGYVYLTEKSNLIQGYYVEFPVPPPPPPSQSYTTPLVRSVNDFIVGIGTSFLSAFTAIFLVDGHLNPLAIFLLCILGLTLGYGCIRWITGMFRKESN